MINELEAVGNLVKPVAIQVLLARDRLETGVAYNPVTETASLGNNVGQCRSPGRRHGYDIKDQEQ